MNKSLICLSLLFLVTFSSLSYVFILPVNASSEWAYVDDYSLLMANSRNPYCGNYNGSDFIAYAEKASINSNTLVLNIVSADNTTLAGTYSLTVTGCTSSWCTVALYQISAYELGIWYLNSTFSTSSSNTLGITYYEFDLNTLTFSTILNSMKDSSSALQYLNMGYVAIGDIVDDGEDFGLSFFFSASSGYTHVLYLSPSQAVSGRFSGTGTKPFSLTVTAKTLDNRILFAFAPSGDNTLFYGWSDLGSGTTISGYGSFEMAENFNSYSFVSSTYVTIGFCQNYGVSATSGANSVKMGLSETESSGNERYAVNVLIMYESTTVYDFSLENKMYLFPNGALLYPKFNAGYNYWYNAPSNLFHYLIYNGGSGTWSLDYILLPAGEGSSLDWIVGDRGFISIEGQSISLYVYGEPTVPVPTFSILPPPTSSAGSGAVFIGDSTSWLIGALVPFLFLLVPALLLGLYFGGTGIIVGLILGIVITGATGLVPLHYLIALVIGLVALIMLKGGHMPSFSKSSGESE